MRVRPALVWLHRYLGLSILAFLVLAGLTGSILIFRARLDALLNPKLFDVATHGSIMAPARLADALAHRHPSWRISARKAYWLSDPGSRRMLSVGFADAERGHGCSVRMSGGCRCGRGALATA